MELRPCFSAAARTCEREGGETDLGSLEAGVVAASVARTMPRAVAMSAPNPKKSCMIILRVGSEGCGGMTFSRRDARSIAGVDERGMNRS